MRIALVVPGFSADERDWCIPGLLNFARALSQRAELEIFTLRYPHRRGSYRIGSASVHSLGWAQRRGGHSAHLWWSAVRAIQARHRAAAFDCLHAVWADEPGWVGAACAQQLGLPLVISLAGGELSHLPAIGYGLQRHPVQRRLIDWALGHATLVSAGSRYMLDLARAHVPDSGRLMLAPLGVDTERFSTMSQASNDELVESNRQTSAGSNAAGSPYRKQGMLSGVGSGTMPAADPDERHDSAPGDALTLINVGSLAAVKGQAQLLRAMRHVVAELPGVRLRIVGDGPLRSALTRQISDLGLATQVTLAGALPHEQMADAYRGTDLFVQTSLHEAEGMALLEATACGVPSVGTAVGVLPELAARGAAMVAPAEERALADAVVGLLRDAARRRVMGRAARAGAGAHYGVERCVERFMEGYGDAVA